MSKTYVRISYSTDLRHPNTEIKKIPINCWKRLIKEKMIKQEEQFAFPGAADTDLPECQQNWHHRLTNYYLVETKYLNELIRNAKKKYKEEREHWRHSMYCPTGWEQYVNIPHEYSVKI